MEKEHINIKVELCIVVNEKMIICKVMEWKFGLSLPIIKEIIIEGKKKEMVLLYLQTNRNIMEISKIIKHKEKVHIIGLMGNIMKVNLLII